tara:strand:+ start:382 stop:594 length:213 start_codon:yes stop_codon:yes gene_type:complete
MDIIKVLKNSLMSSQEENVFEINSILTRPTEKNSIKDLEKAIRSYTTQSNMIETLNKLETQVAESENNNQ